VHFQGDYGCPLENISIFCTWKLDNKQDKSMKSVILNYGHPINTSKAIRK